MALCCLSMVAVCASAQWTEEMYDQYTTKTYSQYPGFRQHVDEENYDAALLEAAIFFEINKQRAKNRLPELKFDAKLSQCAREHSLDMAKHEFFDHVSPTAGRQELGDRLALVGYTDCPYASENIVNVVVRPTYAETARFIVEEKWMGSKIHREIMLRDGLTHIGCGIAIYNESDGGDEDLDHERLYVKATAVFVTMP